LPQASDVTEPHFSPDGTRIAVVVARAIDVWEPASGRITRQLAPLPDGTFPRLVGWNAAGTEPLFTRGESYRDLPRSSEGRRQAPGASAIETAQAGVGRELAAHAAWRRVSRATTAGHCLFYLAHTSDTRRLCVWDNGQERCIASSDSWIYTFAPQGAAQGLLLSASRPGQPARLARLREDGSLAPAPLELRPHLLGLAAGTGTALACGPSLDERGRPLYYLGGSSLTPMLLGQPTDRWFYPAAAERAIAAVRVTADSDGDGQWTPLDRGELWVSWEAP
jgi:hypothetical protein